MGRDRYVRLGPKPHAVDGPELAGALSRTAELPEECSRGPKRRTTGRPASATAMRPSGRKQADRIHWKSCSWGPVALPMTTSGTGARLQRGGAGRGAPAARSVESRIGCPAAGGSGLDGFLSVPLVLRSHGSRSPATLRIRYTEEADRYATSSSTIVHASTRCLSSGCCSLKAITAVRSSGVIACRATRRGAGRCSRPKARRWR